MRGEWLLAVSADDEQTSEAPTLVPPMAAAVAVGMLCLARLVVAGVRGETFTSDLALAVALLAAVAVALVSMCGGSGQARAGRWQGSGGRSPARAPRARRRKGWQAGFPMHARRDFARSIHRPARGQHGVCEVKISSRSTARMSSNVDPRAVKMSSSSTPDSSPAATQH